MNYALLIAGGSGNRMGQEIPKQFIHVDDCPIIVHTMKAFERHPDIEAIAVVCLEGWETVLRSYANQFSITKLRWIFKGGETGMESIHNGIYGLKADGCNDDDLILVHDGVRPLVSQDIISSNIAICLTTTGGKGFSVLITDQIPDLHLIGDAQCFPMFLYETE